MAWWRQRSPRFFHVDPTVGSHNLRRQCAFREKLKCLVWELFGRVRVYVMSSSKSSVPCQELESKLVNQTNLDEWPNCDWFNEARDCVKWPPIFFGPFIWIPLIRSLIHYCRRRTGSICLFPCFQEKATVTGTEKSRKWLMTHWLIGGDDFVRFGIVFLTRIRRLRYASSCHQSIDDQTVPPTPTRTILLQAVQDIYNYNFNFRRVETTNQVIISKDNNRVKQNLPLKFFLYYYY